MHASDRAGSQTDRGRAYVAWGPPDEIEGHPGNTGDVAKPHPLEVWRYHSRDGKPDLYDLELEFAGEDYKLVRGEGPTQ
jgi:hypothetical protein